MGKAMQTRGGKERTKLLTKWKESKWVLEFKKNEFIVPNRKRKPNTKLSKALNNKSKSRTPKPWSELSTQYQREKKKQLSTDVLHPFHSCRMTTLNQCNVN